MLILLPMAMAVMVAGIGYAVAGGAAPAEALGPGRRHHRVDIHHSRFEPDRLTVVEGTRVRFVVVNGDPIHHELITGPPEVHIRHAAGTEAEHPSIPGEVSVDPNGTAVTTFRSTSPACSSSPATYPGHYEYGMRGEIEVVPAERLSRT